MRKRRLLLSLLTAIASASFGDGALAWGDLGHRVICEIATRLVQPRTRDQIQKLVALDAEYKSFSDSCIFADHPRQRAEEHFINFPRDSTGPTSDKCPLADRCVLTAILSDSKVLSSNNGSDQDKLSALKFLGHWVGDIHQPLHVSFLDDRGGNRISVSGQCSRNLHATWDTCLVLYAVGPDPAEAATDLLQDVTPELQKAWRGSQPWDWANESFVISKAASTAYCEMQGSSCNPGRRSLVVGEEYLSANEAVVREQLKKAGVRLAHLLDAALVE